MSDELRLIRCEDLAGKSKQEVLEILQEEGVELTEEQLEMISGGGTFEDNGVGIAWCDKCPAFTFAYWPATEVTCPNCGNTIIVPWPEGYTGPTK